MPKSVSYSKDWELEVESLIEVKIYIHMSITQALGKSLSEQAKIVRVGYGA